jgi:hypothetical protein
MVSIVDYKKEDGSIDFSSYRKAQVDAGEKCYECGEHVTLFAKGYRERCDSCKALDSNADAVSHKSFIRCPSCRQSWETSTFDDDLYDDGEHEVDCPECNHSFTVTTFVSYSFGSPALLPEEVAP